MKIGQMYLYIVQEYQAWKSCAADVEQVHILPCKKENKLNLQVFSRIHQNNEKVSANSKYSHDSIKVALSTFVLGNI